MYKLCITNNYDIKKMQLVNIYAVQDINLNSLQCSEIWPS